MRLSTTLRGRGFTFGGLYDLMGKANEPKSGDTLAGLGAGSAQERVAARMLLADVELSRFVEEPAVDPATDEVTRIILGGLDEGAWAECRSLTVGALRERLLESDGATIRRLGKGLPSEAIAAVAKLCSNLDLALLARRIPVEVRCRTTLGGTSTLSSRVQPNHPTDDPAGILASLREGFSYGCGDAVVGVNPADDTVGAVRRTMDVLTEYVHEVQGVPTQTCVLAHVTTQMEAIRAGSRADLVFQSLSGTEAGCRSFGIDAAMLAEARDLQRSTRPDLGPQVLYFETGQGSELSAGAHHGIDQLVLESRCYGLARAFDPFLVNTVVGFIGPEYLADARQVSRAGLEDHFMGKLHGLPMGVDVCYTNHMDADQNDLESLAIQLASAGCTFFMGVPLGDDVMLNYQTTSYHDVAALRELLGRRPAPEFAEWMVREEILLPDGRLAPHAGDPTWLDARRRTA